MLYVSSKVGIHSHFGMARSICLVDVKKSLFLRCSTNMMNMYSPQ
jgi:hypothetical protein